MVETVFPRIEATAISEQYGRFIITPLEPGYGLTLGNAMRRVLLTSLPGAAATSVRVVGVQHEFAPIPNVREDMTSLMLNLKQVRFQMDGVESGRAHLRVRGPAEVAAADLECPAGIDVVNPELHLATVDSDETEFEMELSISSGKGYSPSEERGQLPIGEIPLDAVFSPVRRAIYAVERERVGPTTDFDRLVMEVWTDGSVAPADAISHAASLLVEHFQLIAMANTAQVAEQTPLLEAEGADEPELVGVDVPIDSLDLNRRAVNCLRRAGIYTVAEVLEKLRNNERELLEIRNFGVKSLEELKEKLAERGLYGPSGAATDAADEAKDVTPVATPEAGVETDEA